MKSLNGIYEKKELYYWCNAAGEINPRNAPTHIGTLEDLPFCPRELYENNWDEGSGCCMYVVEYQNTPGMLLCFLCDYSWASDMLRKPNEKITDVEKEALFRSMEKHAEELEQWLRRKWPALHCEIWSGKDTDPDGHELCVFIPYEVRDKIRDLAEALNNMVYVEIEKTFLKEVEK